MEYCAIYRSDRLRKNATREGSKARDPMIEPEASDECPPANQGFADASAAESDRAGKSGLNGILRIAPHFRTVRGLRIAPRTVRKFGLNGILAGRVGFWRLVVSLHGQCLTVPFFRNHSFTPIECNFG
jgi:hypothetical protein